MAVLFDYYSLLFLFSGFLISENVSLFAAASSNKSMEG